MHNEHRLLSIFMLLIGAGLATPAQAANECKLKYKAGNNSSYQFQNINAGATVTLNKQALAEALNDGRNDILISLESTNFSGQTTTSSTTLVKNAGPTLVLPPMLFNGMKLKTAHCKSFATVLDTQQYLSQFGSPTQVVTAATGVAQTAAQLAQTAAVNLFNPNSATQLQQAVQAAGTEANQFLQQAPQAGQAAIAVAQSNFANHFPELHTAITASMAVSNRIGVAAQQQAQADLQGLQQELLRLDQKYRASQTVQSLFTIDLPLEFPEINSLQNQRCSLTAPPLAELVAQTEVMANTLTALLSKYQPAAAALPQYRLDPPTKSVVDQAQAASTCLTNTQRDLQGAANDLSLFTSHLRDAERELQSLSNDTTLAGNASAAEFMAEVGKALESVRKMQPELDRLVAVRDQLASPFAAAQSAYAAFDPGGRPVYRFQPDGSVLLNAQAILTPLQTAQLETQALGVAEGATPLQKTAPAWAATWKDLPDAYGRWTQTIRALRETAQRGRLDSRTTGRLFGLFDQLRPLAMDARALTATTACAENHAARWDLANGVLRSYNATFWLKLPQTAVAGAAEMLPADVYQQMQTTLESAKHLQGLITPAALLATPPPVTSERLDRTIGALRLFATLLPTGLSMREIFDAIDNALEIGAPQSASVADLLGSINVNLPVDLPSSQEVLEGIGLRATWEDIKVNKDFLDHLRNSATVANQFGQDLTELAGMIGRTTQPNRDVNDVKTVALALEQVRASVWASTANQSGCADRLTQATTSAVQSFDPRLQAFFERRRQALLNAIPPDLKAALSDLLIKTNALLPQYSNVIQKGLAVGPAFTALSTSLLPLQFPGVVTVLPGPGNALAVPMPDTQSRVTINSSGSLVGRTQEAQAKVDALNTALSALEQAGESARVSNDQFLQSLQTYNQRIAFYKAGMPRDLAQLLGVESTFQLIDWVMFPVTVRVEAEVVQSLTPKWQAAVTATPGRLAALLPIPGPTPEMQQALQAGHDFIQQRLAELNSCLSTANARRVSIGQPSQVTSAVNQTVSGLQSEAQTVINNLNALLPPSFNILNQAESALQNASTLAQRVSNAGATATQTLNTNINTLRTEMLTAATCVTSKHGLAISKLNELRGIVN